MRERALPCQTLKLFRYDPQDLHNGGHIKYTQ